MPSTTTIERHPLMLPPVVERNWRRSPIFTGTSLAGGREIANRSQFRTSVGTGSTGPTDAHCGRRQAAGKWNSDRRDQGVEAYARLNGQRTQTQRRVGSLVQECTAGGLGKLKCSTAFAG